MRSGSGVWRKPKAYKNSDNVGSDILYSRMTLFRFVYISCSPGPNHNPSVWSIARGAGGREAGGGRVAGSSGQDIP